MEEILSLPDHEEKQEKSDDMVRIYKQVLCLSAEIAVQILTHDYFPLSLKILTIGVSSSLSVTGKRL